MAQRAMISSKYLCKGCVGCPSQEFTVEGKVSCNAARSDIHPVLKREVSIREQCPHRTATGFDEEHPEPVLYKAQLILLAAFARDHRFDVVAQSHFEDQLKAGTASFIEGEEQRVTM